MEKKLMVLYYAFAFIINVNLVNNYGDSLTSFSVYKTRTTF